MGGFSARKALQVVRNVETVVAIELLAACQALEFFRPLKTTPALERVHALVRQRVAPWDGDRYARCQCFRVPNIHASTPLITYPSILHLHARHTHKRASRLVVALHLTEINCILLCAYSGRVSHYEHVQQCVPH